MSEWQPIHVLHAEPGDAVIAWTEGWDRAVILEWALVNDGKRYGWRISLSDDHERSPTHWMPLPPPPKQAEPRP